ncbi:DNA mismatch repair protein mutS [Fibrella aestuarina BUZ 2]|uniref:DNA mismatch repair protein mutS n=1 Tax=Fibrella aestuarina BUZ 2 TaxID=1166018 RepID=I0K4J0_9BACT|nr:DNA mismatch repair protein MutS [Fibrella aestuarina]CCG99043.1 DNA mismatch repair protein mutS [Fibrella aestuarina BUZ 2]
MLPFTQRQHQFESIAAEAQKQHNTLAIGRLIWFFGTLGTCWLLWANGQSSAGIIVAIVGMIVFVRLMVWHRAVRRRRDLHLNLAAINADELGRLNRQYTRPETGLNFAPPNHAYAQDLDLFGNHSLYRLLNRTHTHEGAARLAYYLLQPARPEHIFLRQQAVEALKPHIDWRQELEATAKLNERIGQSPEGLREWAVGQTPLPGWVNVARFVLPLITLGVVALWLLGNVPGWVVLASLALHGTVLSPLQATSKQVSVQTADMANALTDFADLFRFVENMSGDALLLHDLKQRLRVEHGYASTAIAQLARLVENFNFRQNAYFYLFVGLPTLWDVHYLVALNRWRAQHGPQLATWLATLAEAESLNSLAGFAYAHPTYAQPDLVDETNPVLEATDMAHPLIVPLRAVTNSLAVSGSGQTVLITGSNMSGKSTFLRTLALNVVLAQAGAVASAKRFVCAPVQVYTSMRTQDSLEENTSSFYAELKRLRTLLELTDPKNANVSPLPVLYFLDEILKGTNSTDRHKGAEALIRQLHRTSALGFVSTHDLELGQMGDAVDYVQNYHFRSDIHDGQVTFDYTLRPGICQSFNASQLMAAIGIEL